MSRPTDGARLGGRIADLAAEARIKAAASIADHAEATKSRHITARLEQFEHELKPLMAEMFGDLADNEHAPPELKAALKAVTEPGHQVDFILQIVSFLSFLLQAVFRAGEPFTQQLMNHLWEIHPEMPVSAQAAASAVIRGQLTLQEGAAEAALTGYNMSRFEILTNSGGLPPGVETLMAMHRRGIIGDDLFRRGVQQGDTKVEWADELLRLRYGPPGSGEAVAAAVEGHIDIGRLADLLGQNGIDPGFAQLMYDTHGRPPGPESMLDLFRRGLVDQGTVEQAIRESDIKNKYIPQIISGTYRPPTTGEAVAAAVEGHIDQNTMADIVQQNGIDRRWAGMLYDTAGRPPGAQEMIHLWRRGEVDQGAVEAAIRESDIKNKYIPAILATKRAIPPMRTVVAMLRHGVITQARGLELLKDNGYVAEDAAAMVAEAASTKTQAEKDLAKGEVSALYGARAIDRPAAAGYLAKLGYDTGEQNLILGLVDSARSRRYKEAAGSRVRSLYTGHHISRATASTDLDKIGFSAVEREELLRLWDLERSANVHMLTEAQLRAMVKKNLIDDATYVRRLVELGYTQPDAELLLAVI